jgi:hypothetical protein
MTTTTDYLIKGCGLMGLGFADTLVRETDAHVTLVDERAAPGGHWNDAYAFVTLHQPAPLYGLAASPLGDDAMDPQGCNVGLMRLPSGWEVAVHFRRALQERLLPTGRVRYLPLHRLEDDGEAVSLLTGARERIVPTKALVDATLLQPAIPPRHERSFTVEGGAACVPPQALPDMAPGFRHFVIIGGGKTGLDCVSWLLDQGVAPGSAWWVVPRDAWWSNRRAVQTSPAHRAGTLSMMRRAAEVMAKAGSVQDFCEGLERDAGTLLRLSGDVWPTMYHAATVTEDELARARGIGRIVREGHVQAIEPGGLSLQGGNVRVPAQTLFIDCTARALSRGMESAGPVFGDRHSGPDLRSHAPALIRLQCLRFPMLSLSAALIAAIEARVDDVPTRDGMAQVCRMVDTVEDWIDRMIIGGRNQRAWMAHEGIRNWLSRCRLDPFPGMMAQVPPDGGPEAIDLQRLKDLGPAVQENLLKLRAQPPNSRSKLPM